MRTWLLAAVFIASRTISIVFLEPVAYWDVYYYWLNFNESIKPTELLVEYPTPNIWLLKAIYIVEDQELFIKVFAFTVLLVDLFTTVILWRWDAKAGSFWILFGAAVGPITWFRLDLFSAASVALSCVWLAKHPKLSGTALAIGASLKLWPALLIGAISAYRFTKTGYLRMLAFLVIGTGLGLASLWQVGWARSISPLTWQSDRGLQVESVPATGLMLLKAANPKIWRLELTKFHAYEIFGPGVETILTATSILTVLTLALAIILTLRCYRSARLSGVYWSLLAIISLLIITNKTFSPQYIWWIAGPIAGLIATQKPTETAPRHLPLISYLLATTTQVIYPWAYEQLLSGSTLLTIVLVLRNTGFLVLSFWVFLSAWRFTGSSVPRYDLRSGHRGLLNDSNQESKL